MITKKLFIGIGSIAVVVVALYLTMSNISNPKIPLEWKLSEYASPYNYPYGYHNRTNCWTMAITVYLPYDQIILYNCHIEVRYFTHNNIWKTAISQDFGTLRYPDSKSFIIYLDADFKNSSSYYSTASLWLQFNQTVNVIDIATQEPNFKADIYGYAKP